MTLNDLERRNSLYFAFFTEFDRFSGRLYHNGCLPVPVFYFWRKL